MLPPKGDPRRPLHLAVRSARVLGILFVLLGLCGTLPLMLAGGWAGPGMMTGIIGIAVLLIYFGPGICYLVFASYLSNYRPWAVTATLVVASLHTLLVLLAFIGIVVRVLGAGGGSGMNVGVIPLAIALLVVLAMGQMIYHLVLSYESVRHPPFGRETAYQGFAPIFPTDRPPPPPPGA
jgi:hypothetical protein